MALSPLESLTAHFYNWEQVGRGWYVYKQPVQLEPNFYPFFYYNPPIVDDGRTPTVLSMIADWLKGGLPQQKEMPVEDASSTVGAYSYVAESLLTIVTVSLPKGHKIKVAEAEQLLLMLSYCKDPVSFEIIATHASITLQFACRENDMHQVRSQLKAYFPAITIQEKEDALWNALDTDDYICLMDFGIKEEFMRPLATSKSFDMDSLTGLFGILENLDEGEQGGIQVLFKGTLNPWASSILRSVTDLDGKPFFLNAPEMTKLAEEKVFSPLFGVSIRSFATSPFKNRVERINELIGNTLGRISDSGNNALIPLFSREEYIFDTRLEDIRARQSHRLGMLLNAKELATFVHMPSESVVSQKLIRDTNRTKAAPQIAEGHDFVLGLNVHQSKEKVVSLSNSQRLRHTHIIGATGTGKSTLLVNLIIQDIEQGKGVAVLDPHGDLIESILTRIPEERVKDVVIVDPADADFPVGFNILSAHSEVEKNILSSDLVAAFKRLSASWGDQMNSVLANAILAFLESTQGGTLVDLRRFLLEKSYRESFLKTVADPNIVYYWQKEFPLLKSNSIAPILIRLDTFIRPKLIRNMVAQKKGMDFEHIMDSGKVVLIKLAQGLIGEENSFLLGTFIVSKIHQAAMARQAKQKEDRNDFYLYIDEFQNFITPSMVGILSGARKYHLGMILAHQDMRQLSNGDSELASSVISNAGTRICFRVGDIDAKRFESGFSFFEAKDLQNLHTGDAIVRIDRPEFDFNISTFPFERVDEETAETISTAVIQQSRLRNGTPRQDVEAILEELRGESVNEERSEVLKQTVVSYKAESREVFIPKSKLLPNNEKLLDAPENISIKQELTQHRYLQTFIKKMAESRGFKAIIEEPLPDNKGRVDVSLERNGKRIACEISVTTDKIWEIHNIKKCLNAGYDLVVAISTEKKIVEGMQRKVIEVLKDVPNILVTDPDGLFLYLDKEIVGEVPVETRLKGYRVRVNYEAVSELDSQQKKESIAKVVADSLKKLRKK